MPEPQPLDVTGLTGSQLRRRAQLHQKPAGTAGVVAVVAMVGQVSILLFILLLALVLFELRFSSKYEKVRGGVGSGQVDTWDNKNY